MRAVRIAAIAFIGLVAIGSAAFAAAPPPSSMPAPVAVTAPGVSVSGDAYVPAGQVHNDDLVVIMGDARVDGEVTGDIVVVMGSLDLSGTAHGQIVSVMSRTHLAPTAKVEGEVVNVGWSMQRDEGSEIAGEIVNVNFMNLVPFAGHGGGISGLLRFLFILHFIKLAFLFIIMVIITALIPRRLAIIADAFPTRWGWAFLVGLLVYTGVLLGTIFLAITLIGLPLAFVLWFVAKAVKWIGLAAIFYLMGQSMGRNLFRRELPHLASVLGGFVLFALASCIPILGWVFTLFLNPTALGLVLLTRFGAEPAPQVAPAAPPVPGAAPGGPAGPAAGGPPGIESGPAGWGAPSAPPGPAGGVPPVAY
jgi:hypothetical protein